MRFPVTWDEHALPVYVLQHGGDGTDMLTEVKGTPAFQPPEVFTLEKGQSYSGYAVDIWYATFIQLLSVSGRLPLHCAGHWEQRCIQWRWAYRHTWLITSSSWCVHNLLRS